MKRAIVIFAIATAALVLASGALAGGSSVATGHSSTPPAAKTLGVKVTKKAPAKVAKVVKKSVKKSVKPAAKAATLPFTGVDLAGAGLGGLALLGVGLVLYRPSRRTN